jgi:hypothetical protein
MQTTGKTLVAHAEARTQSLRQANNDEQVPRIDGVPTWRPRWQLLLSRKTSTYGAVVLTIVLYCLVLLNCDVAFIGLAYLVLAVWCLAAQPQKGKWNVLEDSDNSILNDIILGDGAVSPRLTNQPTLLSPSSTAVGASSIALVGSSALSWIPLFLISILSTLDFFSQLTLPGLATNFDISDDVLYFLKTAVGVDYAPTSHELALRLLRPVFILACIYAFRKLYSIGVLHRQLAHATYSEDEYQQHRLAKQWRVGAFIKRFLILHASKIVVFVAFAAAMQDPSALGWALVGKNY